VSRLEVVAVRRTTARVEPTSREVCVVDVDVEVVCSSGTYVRALARDLGAALEVGGHLTALRRTRVGPFGLDVAVTLEQLEESPDVVPLAAAMATAFPRVDVDDATAALVLHGVRIAAPEADSGGEVGVFGPDGAVLALAERRDAQLHYLIVFS
jgi:tRNA pseudouridine55 synthase